MKDIPIVIARGELFRASYSPITVRVAPRGFSSLTLRISGEVGIKSGETSFVSGPDSLTFVPAGCEYETSIPETGEMLVMHYTVAGGSADLCDRPVCVFPQNELLRSIFERAVLRYNNGGSHCDTMADCYRILAEAERAVSASAPAPYKKLRQIKQYIDESLCDSLLRIPALAERFGTSEVYFRREFKKYYGKTPLEYIKKRRIDVACSLLRTRLYSVAEVATRSGFESISYFSSEFRRTVGCSPREYQGF